MVRVLVAEDSSTVRELLVTLLRSDPAVKVVGEARNGREAVDLALRLRPDLITMDVNMPVLDGLQATREIMIGAPTPILIVSSQADVDLSLSAIQAGALMVLPSPGSPLGPDFPQRSAQLLAMVKAMSQVKVVRRWTSRAAPAAPATPPAPVGARRATRVVAIGASTGGPAALHRVLASLPARFSAPILVVQHIAAEFVNGLAHWLGSHTEVRVKVAADGEPLRPRTAYLAPDHYHLGVRPGDEILLSPTPPIGGFRPSATYLFESVAKVYGAAATGVILTGMGRDGVDGLRAVRAAGGLVIAQDEESSVVYGMPGEAVAAGLADAVLPLQEIGPRLASELASGGRYEFSDSGR